ncbi:MAG: hypothetical protein ACETWG_09200 [Candidatus Neomarinimicrobiota bacterium]
MSAVFRAFRAPGASGERQTAAIPLDSGTMTMATTNYPVHRQCHGKIPHPVVALTDENFFENAEFCMDFVEF